MRVVKQFTVCRLAFGVWRSAFGRDGVWENRDAWRAGRFGACLKTSRYLSYRQPDLKT
jgi:hypothetical protein